MFRTILATAASAFMFASFAVTDDSAGISFKISADRYDFYRISLATFGRRVHGYMSVPTDEGKAPFPVRFSVCAVYAAYNAITSNDKKIIHGIGMGHSCRSEYYHACSKWLIE